MPPPGVLAYPGGMYRFEPPPPPEFGGGAEPENPYAAQAPPPRPTGTPENPYALSPGAPWGPPGANHHPRGTTALVLGVLSVCGVAILGPIAWAMAHGALKEADQSPYPVTNRGHLVGAQVTGMIGSLFVLLGFVWTIVLVLIVAGS